MRTTIAPPSTKTNTAIASHLHGGGAGDPTDGHDERIWQDGKRAERPSRENPDRHCRNDDDRREHAVPTSVMMAPTATIETHAARKPIHRARRDRLAPLNRRSSSAISLDPRISRG